MTKQRRTHEERRAEFQKRVQFNSEMGAAVLTKIEEEGKSSKRPGTFQVGENLRLLYNSLYCEHVMDRGRAGWSLNEIAIELHVHPRTLHMWTENYPEFAEAYAYAKKARLAFFERNYRQLSSGECKGSASITAA